MSMTLTLMESQVYPKEDADRESSLPDGNANGLGEEEEEEEGREVELVMFDNTTQGLGLKICGGCSIDGTETYSIFVKRVLPGGLAQTTGEVQEGDLIIEVNSQSMEGVSYDRAISLLRQASASNHVELIITRDADARCEYAEYLARHGPIQSPPTVGNPAPQQPAGESDSEFQRKMVSLLKDTSMELNDSMEQIHSSASGIVPGVNGHTSPASSCASEVANHLEEVTSLPKSSPSLRDTPSDPVNSLLSKKLSKDPGLKLHIDQLESALTSLGLPLSPTSQNSLRQNLSIDADGLVKFEAFVQAAKGVFQSDLRALTERLSPQPTTSQVSQQAGVAVEDYSSVVRERDLLRAEVAALKDEMRGRSQSSHSAEEQLLLVRKQAQASIEEGRSLRSKLHLAEQAQARAQQMEQDYEEVVAMLENEVAQLKLQMSKSDGVNMQKRLAVLVCQLKKAESGKKTYEVATEKLMRYVEHSLDVFSSVDNSPRNVPGADGANKANKKRAVSNLPLEGREVIKTVRSLMETVPLPFGWEEAYTSDGVKYYINHLNQTTTWTHPVSCMEHQTSTQAPPPAPTSSTSHAQHEPSQQQVLSKQQQKQAPSKDQPHQQNQKQVKNKNGPRQSDGSTGHKPSQLVS